MERIVHINTFPYKATGNIMLNIHAGLQREGYSSYAVWGRGRRADNLNEIRMNNELDVRLHGIYTRITDKTGFASRTATRKLLQKLDKINPQIIHLHNLHGYYINIEMLFEYIKEKNIQVIWTLHDCWPFTGHCAYFDYSGCEKWETGCYKCDQKNTYPASIFWDNSNWNWNKKKTIFTGANIHIVTPCKWLKEYVKKSYLKNYCVYVIYNGIDTNIFYPRKSDIKEQYNIRNKKIVLGVASEWTERKGLYDFIRLSQKLPPDEYQIVLIGLTNKQLKELNKNIIGLSRTADMNELAEWYSIADVFVNPTYEDNFPTTNLEAVACGTPVITYKTGGSPESINGYNCGVVVEKGDIEALKKTIMEMDTSQNIVLDNSFTKEKMIEKYILLYNMILGRDK